MATFHFELVSPERLLFSGDVDKSWRRAPTGSSPCSRITRPS